MFSKYFKAARKAVGLTHIQMADELGCDRVAVSNWENGRNLPDPKKIPAIAKLLKVPPGELMRLAYPDAKGMDYAAGPPAAVEPDAKAIMAAVEKLSDKEFARLQVLLRHKAELAEIDRPPPAIPKKPPKTA